MNSIGQKPFPFPGWSFISQELSELDIFLINHRIPDFKRCNVIIIFHNTDEPSANIEFLKASLQKVNKKIPVVLSGFLSHDKVSLGEFAFFPLHSKWSKLHRSLALEYQNVYALDYCSPGIWRESLNTFYKAQMAVLYDKTELLENEKMFSIIQHIINSLEGNDYGFLGLKGISNLWDRLYQRNISEDELNLLLKEASAIDSKSLSETELLRYSKVETFHHKDF